MKCYYCGAELNSTDYCPSCGTDVNVWKIIVCISNRFYNDGLEKASVRDLTGAVESLKMSLHYNKMNREARNLLGLVYFEMGEPASAMSEWVISKSLSPVKNPASEYLNQIQKSSAKLENMKQASLKMNQALTYCKDGSYDMAVIQMKKVLSLNPKSMKGLHLMALLYMRDGKYDQAIRYLKQAEKIDEYNADTMRYMSECRNRKYNGMNKKGSLKDSDEVLTYQSGNETIINPGKIKDRTPIMTVLNLLVGLAIGVAVAWVLVIPQIRHTANSDANKQLVEANETIAGKDDTIESLQTQIDDLNTQLDTANETITAANEKNTSYQNLLNAYGAYMEQDYSTAETDLKAINRDSLDEENQSLYDTLFSACATAMLGGKLQEAETDYFQRDYDACIPLFLEVVGQDEGYSDGEAAYYLGYSYVYTKDYESARKWFEVTEKYASGTILSDAQNMINQIDILTQSSTATTEEADTTENADTTTTDAGTTEN